MPLDGNHPTLFLQFAATPPTKQDILGFIDKFGILGLSYSSKIGGDRLVGVEPIEVWETEITTLRDCLAYWQSIRHGEFISSRKTQSIESSYKGLQEFFKKTPLKNIPCSFKRFVLDKICAHIHINCEFEPSAVVNSDDSGIDFAIKPTNLLSAIWLQFVGAICTDNVYGTCGYCGALFKAKRKSALYCSGSHRQMAYRKRKETRK